MKYFYDMPKSMTAYASGAKTSNFGSYSIEVQTVNRKHQELNVFLPRELSSLDPEIRKMIGDKVGRGQITVKVKVDFSQETPFKIRPNLALAAQLKEGWEQVAALFGQKEINLSLLARDPNLFSYEEDSSNLQLVKDQVLSLLKETLNRLNAMKELEGVALAEDINKRLAVLEKIHAEIVKLAPEATQKYKEKILTKLKEIVPGMLAEDERLLKEVALYGESCDISEEITRFASHLAQFQALLKKNEPVAKTMDFLIQELFREINTIGSKAKDLGITQNVIATKTELERIREQIQNIE